MFLKRLKDFDGVFNFNFCLLLFFGDMIDSNLLDFGMLS